jgi:predicted RNase H-like nuclease (RuvC/YqgF family)
MEIVMKNNIGIIVGAIIISITVFFTFNKEEKVIKNNYQEIQQYEVEKRVLEKRLQKLQAKVRDLNNDSMEVALLKDEIKNLEEKIRAKPKVNNNIKDEIRGTSNIYTYLKTRDIKEVSSSDKKHTVYKESIKTDLDNKSGSIEPPSAPALYSMDDNGKKVYYGADPSAEKVSVLTKDSTSNEYVLRFQDHSENIVESKSPPVPPSVFGSTIPKN